MFGKFCSFLWTSRTTAKHWTSTIHQVMRSGRSACTSRTHSNVWPGTTPLVIESWSGKSPAAGPYGMDQWLKDVRASINMWPLQKTAHVVTNQMATEVFMRRERRRLQARHIWEKIEPDWPMIRDRVWTKQATGLPYDALLRRLFLHYYTEESRWLENSYGEDSCGQARTWNMEENKETGNWKTKAGVGKCEN